MDTVFLVGYRACGKTTVAKTLAKSGWLTLDTDALLVKKAQSDIASIVEKYGWDYFRDLECQTLHNLFEGQDGLHTHSKESVKRIIATGGGIILRKENRALLKKMSAEKKALTIFLDLPVDTIVARLTRNPLHGQRPSLTDATLIDEVAQVLAARLPLYKDVADVILDARRPIKDLVVEIDRMINK